MMLPGAWDDAAWCLGCCCMVLRGDGDVLGCYYLAVVCVAGVCVAGVAGVAGVGVAGEDGEV